MRAETIDSRHFWPVPLVPRNGVLVLSGYGLDIRVWRGQLRVEDGIGKVRRNGLIHRSAGGLKRVVVLGHSGSISFDAIRLISDIGAGYIQVDPDGRVLAAFGPQGTDRPGLRRAQARALDTPLGDDIARRLITEKVTGQAETLAAVGRLSPVDDAVRKAMTAAAARVHLAPNRDELRLGEALAAAAYWSAWASVSVHFARRDSDRVPSHWRNVGSRSSVLTGGPRLATSPAQALFNLTYALLEAEASLAARVVGLDPGLGVLHADQLNRDSLSADLMEPVRPLVDRYLLRLIESRPFAWADFYETRQGVCRITPLLAKELAETLPEWRLAVGRVAEDVARLLDDDRRSGKAIPTPITGLNRGRGRGPIANPRRTKAPTRLSRRCVWCGAPVTAGRQTCSDACQDAVAWDNLPAFVAAGQKNLARWLEDGGRAELTEQGKAEIGSRSAEAVRKAREWQHTHPWPSDLSVFERDLFPKLVDVTARALAEATGLSIGYCRQVKKGAATPHPMWWEAMRTLAE